MLWLDWGFDYSDQLAHKYMKYKGEYYDVGTICKIKGRCGPVLARFLGWKYNNQWCFETVEASQSHELHSSYSPSGVMDYCLEIVIPVRPNLQQVETTSGNDREKPPSWDVEIAWIWYIFIMVIAVIFKDRWLIWAFVTAVFFLWKSGFLNGGKK